MAGKSTVLLGSFYDISDLGADAFIRDFKDSHDNPDSAPFLAYDQELRSFVLEVDNEVDNDELINNLLRRLEGYIGFNEGRVSGFETGLRCRPVEGIFPDDDILESDDESNKLLDYDSDDHTYLHDAQDSLQRLTKVWRPQDDDIDILPRMFANEISRLTGTEIFAKPGEKRYHLLNGDPEHALQKLSNLEPLLGSIKRSCMSESVISNGNLLIWPPAGDDKGAIDFVNLNPTHPAFSRVIVNQAEQAMLPRKLIVELRQYQDDSTFHIPLNLQLQNVSQTAQTSGSRIWAGHTFDSFGEASNVEPITDAVRSTSMAKSDTASFQDHTQARIAQWNNSVVPRANPDIAPEAPVEPTGPSRRRVAVDSDSEDDKPLHEKNGRANPDLPVEAVDQPNFQSFNMNPQGARENHSGVTEQDGDTCHLVASSAWRLSEAFDVQAPEVPATYVPPTNVQPPAPASLLRESIPPGISTDTPAGSSKSQVQPTTDAASSGSQQRLSRGRGGSRGQTRGSEQRRGTFAQRAAGSFEHPARHSGPATVSSHNQHRGQSNRTTRPVRGQGGHSDRGRGQWGTTQSHPMTLIDIEPNSPTHSPTPPPGFDYRNANIERSRNQHDGVQSPKETNRDQQKALESVNETSSGSRSGDSHVRFSNEGADYYATQASCRDVNAIAAARLAELRAEAEARKKALKENKLSNSDPPAVFRSTMRQKARNPGKSPNKNPKEKKPLDSPNLGAKRPTKPPAHRADEGVSQAKKSQIKKNPLMAKENSDLAEILQREQQSRKLVQLLEPLFEMVRSFSGSLYFEAQFGQVLVSPTHHVSGMQLHSQERWAEIFDRKQGKSLSPSSFTRIVTTNGADVDRALETKFKVGNAKIKTWSASPGPSSVSYEFSCHSRSNEDFVIAIDQSGKHELRKGSITTGMINVHIPSQIWDAAFVLTGSLGWLDAPDIIIKSVITFVDSLYILPGREKLMMVFRQPNDHEIEVRNLVVRRVSLHRCNLPGYEKLQLKVTEVKSLQFKRHHQDTNLWQAYESPHDSHDKLMRDGRIHYELSIIHTGINEALAQNKSLEVGELTDEATTGKCLLQLETMTPMLDLVVKMVSKLDFMGMANIGTLYRGLLEEGERRRNLGDILGPTAGSAMPSTTVVPPMAPSGSMQMPQPASRVDPTVELPLQGIRVNTVAEIIKHLDGSRYYRGLGGAHVPVGDDFPENSDRSIAPEDSATQDGDMMRRPLPPFAGGSPIATPFHDGSPGGTKLHEPGAPKTGGDPFFW